MLLQALASGLDFLCVADPIARGILKPLHLPLPMCRHFPKPLDTACLSVQLPQVSFIYLVLPSTHFGCFFQVLGLFLDLRSRVALEFDHYMLWKWIRVALHA